MKTKVTIEATLDPEFNYGNDFTSVSFTSSSDETWINLTVNFVQILSALGYVIRLSPEELHYILKEESSRKFD